MPIRLQHLVPAATLLFACLLSSESKAAPRARDSFFVQFTTGLGLPHYAITGEDYFSASTQDHYEATDSGESIGGSVLLGVPLRPGLALGLGGLFAMSVTQRSSLTRNGQPWSLVDVKDDPFRFMGMAGPFIDYYPSSTLGWHVQALVGYAELTYAQITQNPFSGGSPTGIGLMAGVGHDWWVDDEWSIGLLARVTYANTHLSTTPFADGIGAVSQHNTLVLPSLDVTFTAH